MKRLIINCETSGLNSQNLFNPSLHGNGKYYQPLSWGLVIVDEKYNILDELYVEIKWDGKSIWESDAERVHGLTIEYLQQNGISELEAVEEIGGFIFEAFETQTIQIAGYNTLFALNFLNEMFKRYDIQLNFKNRLIDLNTLSTVLLEVNTRDELFEVMGFKKGVRNALVVTRNIAKCFKQINHMWNTLL